jgi:hypothetical protein
VQRGYKVIVPVDCPAGDSVYHEQCAAFQLAKGGPVGITANVTLTRTTMVKFQCRGERERDALCQGRT